MRKFLWVFIFSVFASNVLATGAWQSCNGVGPIGSAASVCQDLVKNAGESYEFSHTEAQDESTVACYAKYKGGSGSPDLVGSACKIDGVGIPEGEGNPIELPVSDAPTQSEPEDSEGESESAQDKPENSEKDSTKPTSTQGNPKNSEKSSTKSTPTNKTPVGGSSKKNQPTPKCPNETYVNKTGERVIKSTLEHGTGKTKFQHRLFKGVEIGLSGWDRAHSQGVITGTESPEAIYYAPEEVNLSWMKRVEIFLSDLATAKQKDDERLCLMTVTSAHPLTLRLAEIQYEVTALKAGNKSKTILIASIQVENKRFNPKVTTEASYTGF